MTCWIMRANISIRKATLLGDKAIQLALKNCGGDTRHSKDVNMNRKKPTPIYSETPKKICPFCGQPSYSREGIHPQCAAADADVKRVKRMKKEIEPQVKKPAGKSRWKKECPQCGTNVHPRLKACTCGQLLIK